MTSAQTAGKSDTSREASLPKRNEQFVANYLAAIVENSEDAIVTKDLDGQITSWNTAAAHIFGHAPEEIVGRSIMTIIPPRFQEQEREILARLRRGERISHFETFRMAKDGHEISVSLSISPIKDSEGRIIGAAKIARDITERKRAEALLAEARAQLEKRAEDLELRVQQRTVRLQQTVSESEAFSYSLSHDMRAPLRAIEGYTHLVLEGCRDQISPSCVAYLNKVIASAERLDRLIVDMLGFTKLSREEITPVAVDLDKLVREIIQERTDFQLPNAAITIASPLPFVVGHEASLTQCITNLVENAIKYVARGVRPIVRIHSENFENGVRVWFEDNGIGIDAPGQRRLFQMFQRIHGEEYEGMGIGLAIVRKAVERMHGSVGVESQPGVGSRFWLQLPKAKS